MSASKPASSKPAKKARPGRPAGWSKPEGKLEGKMLHLLPADWVRVKAAAEQADVSVNHFLREIITGKLDRL
jgi:hypothetical protein